MRVSNFTVTLGLIVAGACSLWGAGVFYADGFGNSLHAADPATGRIKGCYTMLDFALGHLAPAEWTRSLEQSLAILCVLAAVASAITIFRVGRWREHHLTGV